MSSSSIQAGFRLTGFAVAVGAASFMVSASASDTAEYVVHTFATSNTASSPHDGVVIGSDGALYGTSYWGGTAGVGTVFRIAADGTETVLHNFTLADPNTGINADGMEPNARLTLGKDGNLYGVTTTGGPGVCGTLFRIAPTGAFSVVHAFTGARFEGPETALIPDANGNLYGISYGCETNAPANGPALFRYSLDGTFTIIHAFAAGETVPELGIAFGADGNLYGASNRGNAGGYGSIVRLTLSGGYTELYTFSNAGTDGYYPITVPAWGSDGNLYGIAPAGGANGNGVVYRLTPQGSYSVVHAFDPYNPTSKTNLDGDNIYLYENRDLTLGSDGSLYGSLSSGGALAGGTNFAIGADGSYTALTSTELKFIGSPQDGKLAEAASGTFYGVTGAGNGNGGTLFRMVVHSGTSVNAKVSTGSTTLYHPVKISWTSTNAASCALIGDLPKKLKVSVPLNGSKTWYPSKSGRAVVGVQCKTADGGQVNSAQAVVVN